MVSHSRVIGCSQLFTCTHIKSWVDRETLWSIFYWLRLNTFVGFSQTKTNPEFAQLIIHSGLGPFSTKIQKLIMLWLLLKRFSLWRQNIDRELAILFWKYKLLSIIISCFVVSRSDSHCIRAEEQHACLYVCVCVCNTG